MKAKKKNKLLTFIFSLIPGAGEMYMGFMRTGISLMTMFMLGFFLPAFLRIEELMLFDVIVWFYGFFHANHLRSLSDEEFAQVEDRLMFGLENWVVEKPWKKIIVGEKVQKWIAAALIFTGVILLWNVVLDILSGFLPDSFFYWLWNWSSYIPRILIAVAIIYAGIRMIKGRKEQLERLPIEPVEKSDERTMEAAAAEKTSESIESETESVTEKRAEQEA